MSSGAGAGNAVPGWAVNAGSSTSMTSRSHPSSRSANPAVVIAAIGAASATMNPIRAAGSRRVDRQIRRPGLQHRQNRHDRLGGPGKQQRHTLHPGPHHGRPTGAPTGSRPHRARGRSSNGSPHASATASGARATCAANNTGIDTAAVAGSGQHRPVTPPHPAGRAHRHPAHPPTTTDRAGSAVIATNTRPNRPAKSETSKFENGCPAPAVLRKSWSPAPEKINPKPPTRPELVI